MDKRFRSGPTASGKPDGERRGGVPALSLLSRPVVADGVEFRDLGGEAVLLHAGTGRYFGLDETGTRIWTLLVEQGDLASVHRRMLELYEVESARLEQDILAFVEALSAQGLVVLGGPDEESPGSTRAHDPD